MSDKGKAEKPSFEELLKRLEQTVARLESEEVSLDEAMAAYREAVQLIKECRVQLGKAEQEVLKLIQENGNWTTEPLDPTKEKGTA